MQHFILDSEDGVIAMKRKYKRIGFTAAQKAELWVKASTQDLRLKGKEGGAPWGTLPLFLLAEALPGVGKLLFGILHLAGVAVSIAVPGAHRLVDPWAVSLALGFAKSRMANPHALSFRLTGVAIS